jgi:FkbM family methyltransferase
VPNLARHAARALRNAFLSPGARLFGPRFAADYLRFAFASARRWGDAGAGELRLLGRRVEYLNRTHALFLVHEVFVGAAYAFRAATPRPVVLDCGANVGMSVLFFKLQHPDARVVAFEPEPAAFARLRRMVEENGLAGVELHEAAVGGEEGTIDFYGEAGSITASADPAWGGSEARRVAAVRLSRFVTGPVDFLKLDVEGAEYAVVDDLARTGALAQVRQAVIEWHEVATEPRGPERLMEVLRGAGMEVERQSDDPSGRLGVLRAWRVG